MESILMLVNSESFSKIIGSIILMVCCFLAIVSMFKSNLTVFFKKILGSLLIIGITLFANHIMTYSIAVIIIGTLIAESKFLENIWAIIFKNKDYFASQATEVAKKKKVIKQIKSESPISFENIEEVSSTEGNLIGSDNSYNEKVNQVIELKNEIKNSLVSVETGVFEPSSTIFDVVISNSVGENVIIDCIAKGKEINFYCIEIKQFSSLSTLYNSIEQLKVNIKFLEKYYKTECIMAKVRGILVVPESCDLKDDFYDGFAILKYSQNTKSFSNKGVICEWIQ